MLKTVISFIFLSYSLASFSQRKGRSSESQTHSENLRSLSDFYYKIWNAPLLANFTSKNAPTIGVGSNEAKFTTPDDTISIRAERPTYKDQTHILEFVGHPVFNDSIRGRLEMFSSVCWDGSCVREVSSKLYFDFEEEYDAEKFMKSLFELLRPFSDTTWHTKENGVEKYEFASDLRPDRYERNMLRYWQFISLTLSRRKVGCGFQIQINDY